MMDVCERAGHLTANQVGYHLFDRRMEKAVLPYCQAHGIGFMAYGTLAFGLLTGAFTPETTFLDWDWRSQRHAPLACPSSSASSSSKSSRSAARLQELAAGYGKSRGPARHRLGACGNPAVSCGAGGHAQRKGAARERRRRRLELTAEDQGRDRPHL